MKNPWYVRQKQQGRRQRRNSILFFNAYGDRCRRIYPGQEVFSERTLRIFRVTWKDSKALRCRLAIMGKFFIENAIFGELKGTEFLVAYDRARFSGCAQVHTRSQRPILNKLFVVPPSREKGTGTAICATANELYPGVVVEAPTEEAFRCCRRGGIEFLIPASM